MLLRYIVLQSFKSYNIEFVFHIRTSWTYIIIMNIVLEVKLDLTKNIIKIY